MQDPVAAFFAAQAGIDFAQNLVLKDNQIIMLFFQSMTNTQGQVMNIGDSPVADWSANKCVITFNPEVLVSATNEPVTQPDMTVYKQRRMQCDMRQLNEKLSKFGTYLSALRTAVSEEDLEKARAWVMTVVGSDVWFACESVISQALVKGTTQVQISSKDCVAAPDSPAWGSDPCCNRTLAMTQCCAARSVSVRTPILSSVDQAFVSRTCNKAGAAGFASVINTLNTYISTINSLEDRNKGCAAQTSNALGAARDRGQAWQTLGSFMQECYQAVWGNNGQGDTCERDEDCVTECVKQNSQDPTSSGKCAIPFGDPSPYLVKCFVKKMDPAVRSVLLTMWGATSADDAAYFEQQLVARTSVNQCVGPSSWNHNGGWFRNETEYTYSFNPDTREFTKTATGGTMKVPCGGPIKQMQDQGCVEELPSEAGCLSEIACNNGNPQADQAECTQDKLNNGGYFW